MKVLVVIEPGRRDDAMRMLKCHLKYLEQMAGPGAANAEPHGKHPCTEYNKEGNTREDPRHTR